MSVEHIQVHHQEREMFDNPYTVHTILDPQHSEINPLLRLTEEPVRRVLDVRFYSSQTLQRCDFIENGSEYFGEISVVTQEEDNVAIQSFGKGEFRFYDKGLNALLITGEVRKFNPEKMIGFLMRNSEDLQIQGMIDLVRSIRFPLVDRL